MMEVITYNKLVRDRIPEIIEKDGKTCETEVLADKDYLAMLDAKLDEERSFDIIDVNMSLIY